MTFTVDKVPKGCLPQKPFGFLASHSLLGLTQYFTSPCLVVIIR